MEVHFVIEIPPSNHVVGKRHAFSIDELERKGGLDKKNLREYNVLWGWIS